jgi:hypothetical protein
MFIKADCYTIEHGDSYGYRLTVSLPSDHPKSKSGIRSIATFHANLNQVAAKMLSYEIARSDVESVSALADVVEESSRKLADALRDSK